MVRLAPSKAHDREGCGADSTAEKRSSKRVFLESPFLLFPLRVFSVLRASLNGAEKKRTLQNHNFGRPFPRTTPSPLLWRALKNGGIDCCESDHDIL